VLSFAQRWLKPMLPLLVVLALLAILYPEAMFQGKVFGSADAAANEAFRQVGDGARSETGYPLWNPYIFTGMPSFGSLSYTLGVYPPTLVFEFMQDHLGAPPLTWLLGHLLFGGLGMWWLMGRWQTPWGGRVLACVAFLFFARVVAWGVYGHGTKVGAAMYLPWLLGLSWDILTKGSLRATALAALLLGLQFLRGHPQISYYTLLMLGTLTVWHLVWPLTGDRAMPMVRRLRGGGLMALVVVLGFSIGAAQLLPNHDYASISTRGAGGASGGSGSAYDFATSWSMGPEDLSAVFLPAAAGFGKATYLGRMPFNDYPNFAGLLLPLLVGLAWLSKRRSLVIGLAVVSALAILLSMGRHSPGLYQLCYNILPYFTKLRIPSMIVVVPALLGAVLAALGATALANSDESRTLLVRRLGLAVLAVGGLVLLMGAMSLVQGAYKESLTAMAAKSGKQAAAVILDAAWSLHKSFLIRQGLVMLVAGGALLLAAKRLSFRRQWLVPVLAVLVAVDMGGVAKLVTHPERSLSQVVRTRDGGGRLAPATRMVRPWQGAAPIQVDPELAKVLTQTVGHQRLFPLGQDSQENAYMTEGVRSLGGYHPAKPAVAEALRQRLFGREPAGTLATWLSAAAITYPAVLSPELISVLARTGLEVAPEGTPAGGTRVYEILNTQPRARLMDQWQPVSVLPEGDALEPFLDAMVAGSWDSRAQTILDQTPVPEPQTGPEPLPEPEFVVDGLNEIVLSVHTPRPALLLLSDLMAPGWQVTVNGARAPLLTADLILRAVALDEGANEVRFEYRDPALKRGLILALVGVLVTLGLLVVTWIRRQPRSAANPPDLSEGDRHGNVS